MTIWKRDFTVEALNLGLRNTLCEALGMEVTVIHDDGVSGTMPVDSRTVQPMRLLHGGASVALAESLGSMAANMACEPGSYCVGLEINANHIRSATSGLVTGKARAIHIGRSTQIWEINIMDDKGRMVCISRLTMAVKSQNS
ncbi:hotdog fold thioesterase [Sansalvadorimonas sp. 2012CJ34-2]|uniref:Hotdog fold thioesterase n=1 Tax=Parendozoicomonas callyspongiae TaxID=2942213 RepID=A0ABT0PC89_9GAMM|nr:hotdog fold thioesterase [Sansalvadorimonas sp. 2012CJ34-2]MCL6268661.1 hotdog fold thioesterase [Sansalvadorimonas sp. 2012CJ34-2]